MNIFEFCSICLMKIVKMLWHSRILQAEHDIENKTVKVMLQNSHTDMCSMC